MVLDLGSVELLAVMAQLLVLRLLLGLGLLPEELVLLRVLPCVLIVGFVQLHRGGCFVHRSRFGYRLRV